MNGPEDKPRPFFDPSRIGGDEGKLNPSVPPPADRSPVGRASRKKRRTKKAEPPSQMGSLFPEPAPAAIEPATAARASEPLTLTVSELNQIVKGAIQRALPTQVHVVGEISNIARPSGGHVYFTLKDQKSEIRCVMWRSSAQNIKFDLSDGLEVIATGTVEVFEPKGQYQLYIRRIEPRGVGSLELAFRQLKERLEKEGLFDPRRKRPLPRFPSRIAVVTSTTGAALRDILQTIHRRYRCVEIFIYGVRVQGEGAALEVAQAIERINQVSVKLGGIDVMIVGRGGGSLEDLWAFNEEVVARAIHASLIPIVSAVGHEVDFTIADFVADIRAATPTAAAELVVPLLEDLLLGLDGVEHRLSRALHRRLETANASLKAIERLQWFQDPTGQLRRKSQQVDELLTRLRYVLLRALGGRREKLQSAEVRLVRCRPAAQIASRVQRLTKIHNRLQWAFRDMLAQRERKLAIVNNRFVAASPRARAKTAKLLLDQLSSRMDRAVKRSASDRVASVAILENRLQASSHQQVLNRGFSITRRKQGMLVVRKGGDVAKGDVLLTETADGKIESQVLATDNQKNDQR